jgi:hypothetical protein
MYESRIVNSEKEFVIDAQKDQIKVTVEFFRTTDDGEEVVKQIYGYPLESSADDIKTDIAKCLATFNADAQYQIDNAEKEELDRQVDSVINDLNGQPE